MSDRGEFRTDWVDPETGGPANEFRSLHVLFEISMVASSLAFAVVLFRGWRRSAAALNRTRLSLGESQRLVAQRQSERDAWRRSAESALAGFSEAINRQKAGLQGRAELAAFFLQDLMLP